MALKDSKEWLEELTSLTPTVYMLGEKLEKAYENPQVLGYARGMAAIRRDLNSPMYKEIGSTIRSTLINEDINVFADIHEGPEPWIARTRIQRKINRRRICVHRCLQADLSNAFWALTYETDQKYNTEYHKRLIEWVKHMQKTDHTIAGAFADARGDRTKPPHEQPDAYVRVIEKKKDGIVIRGCKPYVSMATCCNELFIAPAPLKGRYTPTTEDKDFAVACAIPIDTEGVKLIARVPQVRRSKTSLKMDYPFSRAGVGDLIFMTVFDDVFVPWERVFLCGEWDMLEKVTSWIGCHFQAKGGCKAALLDLLCGAAALAAEYNGIENTPQVKEKLTTLMSWAEEAYAASIGAAVEGEKHPSGVWIPNLAMTSANKWLCLEHGGDQNNILLDIGGGIVTTAPQETEWDNPEIRGYMDKYLVGKREFSAIDRVRVMKLIEDLTTSEFGGFLRNMNPGGELQAARELVYSLYDIEDRKRTARVIAGLEEKDSIGFTWHR